MSPTNRSAALLASLLVGSLVHPTTDTAALAQPAADDGVVPYTIDTAKSQLHVLVYRAGALARLGHNHIIAAGHIEGAVYLHPEASNSVLELTLPVAKFVIDDPNLRQIEGDGFDSVPNQKDIAGTRRNMTGKRLLDVTNFPTIHVSGRELWLDEEEPPTIEITIQVKDTSLVRRVPLALSIGSEEITASGIVALTHEEFGLRPFSAALGALKVASTMTVRFALSFQRADSPAATPRS